MEIKKKKIIIFVLIIVVLFSLIFALINIFDKNATNNELDNSNVTDKYVYEFGETLDLEEDDGLEEFIDLGTDYNSLGISNEDYNHDVYVGYNDSEIFMETNNGGITISPYWKEEGAAKEINEPEFGEIEKFIIKDNDSISARYKDVNIKDVIKYVKDLSDLGFTNVRLDNINKKQDYYYYYALKSNGAAVTLTYEKGILSIEVKEL